MGFLLSRFHALCPSNSMSFGDSCRLPLPFMHCEALCCRPWGVVHEVPSFGTLMRWPCCFWVLVDASLVPWIVPVHIVLVCPCHPSRCDATPGGCSRAAYRQILMATG